MEDMDIMILPFTNFVDDITGLVENPAACQSAQCKCLSKYLSELGVRSIVLEPEYTDAGYLVDYANYYSRCYDEYDRLTTRLHFFVEEPAEMEKYFESFLSGTHAVPATKAAQDAYRGFVVLKPLPSTIIGRSCLSVYPQHDTDTGRVREFPVLRTYGVNLYGLPLAVNSVAFQEQDNEVAACATTAIWYAFHGLANKFAVDYIPSPFEITDDSASFTNGQVLGEVTRKFPTSGLTQEQIEAKLRSEGLECIVRTLEPENTAEWLKEYTAAYVRGGYPMIVTGKLYTSASEHGDYKLSGGHAMTALGDAYDPKFLPGNWSQRLQRLFAHDDNIGPFASFRFIACEAGEFEAQTQPANGSIEGRRFSVLEEAIRHVQPKTFEHRVRGYLANESGNNTVGRVFRRFVPSAFVVPVPPKVRMSYELVRSFANYAEGLFKLDWPQTNPGREMPQLSWSAVLLNVSSLRTKVANSKEMLREDARAFLQWAAPRHMWQLQFSINDGKGHDIPCVDFIFDATALRQGGGLVAPLRYKDSFAAEIMGILVRWTQKNADVPQDPDLVPVLKTLREMFEQSSAFTEEEQ